MTKYTCKNCKSMNCPIFKPEAFKNPNFGESGDMTDSIIFAVVDTVGCKFNEESDHE